jgi:EmrB/QacA subfamily drug resistance transporter
VETGAVLSRRQKGLVLVACILGSTVAFLDTSVVNVALPAIQADLGGGLLGQQWVANAYLLTLGALLLVGGSLGDIYGRRRVFAIGVAAFGAFSLICAAATGIGVLVAARALQGAAAALLVPMALAVITATFERHERGAAIGAWTAWSGIGVAVGPLIGGGLVDAASWRWVFAINLPLVAVTLALILRAVPRDEPIAGRRLDVSGGLLGSLGLAALTFGLLQQPTEGWGHASVWAPLIGSAALIAGFLGYEARAPAPMLPLALFRRRNFAIGNLETFAMYGGLGLLFFYLVIFLQQVAGYSAIEAGLAMLPVTLLLLLLASRFGRLADRFGPRAFMAGGPLISALGLAFLLRLGAEVDFVTELLPGLLLFSLGLAMTVAPLTATVLGDVDEVDAGLASGVNNAIARVAGVIGIAVVGVAIAASFSGELTRTLEATELSPQARTALRVAQERPLIPPAVEGLDPEEQRMIANAVEEASVGGFRLGMGLAVGLVVAAGLLGAAGIRNPLREVPPSECAGGQLAGQPRDAARRAEECGQRLLEPSGRRQTAQRA